MNHRILCVWLPDWPIQRLLAERPELDGCFPEAAGRSSTPSERETDGVEFRPTVPILLTAPAGRSGLAVAACCPRAAAAGVRAGMPVAEAQALLLRERREVRGPWSVVRGEDTCVTRPHDPRADRRALRRLAGWCQRFSPHVGLEDAGEPESLFFDITGCAHLFGGERALREQVVRAFARRRLAVRAAVADTPGAAWALAHYGGSSGEDRRSRTAGEVGGRGWRMENGGWPERVADSAETQPAAMDHPRHRASTRYGVLSTHRQPTDHGRRTTGHSPLTSPPPSSILHPPSSFPDPLPACDLRALPVQALRLPGEIIEALREFDLRTVGQVEALPRGTLPARFGPMLLERLDQLFGRVPETFAPERFPLPIEAGWIFDDPVADRRTLEIVLGRLVTQVVTRLERRGEGIVRLVCRFDNGPPTLALSLTRPTRSVRHLSELLRLRLERLTFSGEIAAVSVRAAVTAPLETHQLELFATEAGRGGRDRRRAVTALVERLTCRLGERLVLRPRLVPDFQPECAVRFEPLLGQQTFRFAWPEPDRTRRGSSGPTRSAGRGRSGKRACVDHRASYATGPSILHPPLRCRPLCLLATPVRIPATSIIPDGPPIRFAWAGREQRVLRWWGAERIETGWWRRSHVRRDYYRVETATGEQFWLFRERPDSAWFLHGRFG